MAQDMSRVLPIKLRRSGESYQISFGSIYGATLYLYYSDIAANRVEPGRLSQAEAEALAKRIANTLTEAWSNE